MASLANQGGAVRGQGAQIDPAVVVHRGQDGREHAAEGLAVHLFFHKSVLGADSASVVVRQPAIELIGISRLTHQLIYQ